MEIASPDALTSTLVELAQQRPDLLPRTRQMLFLSEKIIPKLDIDMQMAHKYILLHELGKYLTAESPEPLRIAVCDLPSGLLIQHALKSIPSADIELPVPGIIVALIAYLELRTMPGGKVLSLHQRHLYMDRHYSPEHPQYLNWQRLLPLAEVIDAKL